MLQSVGVPRCEPSEMGAASCQYLLWNVVVITASHTNTHFILPPLWQAGLVYIVYRRKPMIWEVMEVAYYMPLVMWLTLRGANIFNVSFHMGATRPINSTIHALVFVLELIHS